MKKEIGVLERPATGLGLLLSLQHLFAMFGSTVLVPNILGVDPAICLLMNGIGTLLYIFITKGKIPAYLGSSFAFIVPALTVIGTQASGAATRPRSAASSPPASSSRLSRSSCSSPAPAGSTSSSRPPRWARSSPSSASS